MLACLPASGARLIEEVQRQDHERLVDSARRHGLSAVLLDALAARGLVLTPGPAAELTRAARAQIAHGLRLKRLTLQVVDALAGAGVVPTLLKGAGLASRLYPEQPLGRPSVDVDVLVAQAELGLAAGALQLLGLREQRDESLQDVFEEHHHVAFSGPAGLVEVHFRLFSGFGGGVFDDAGIRSRLREGELQGRKVRWLSPEDEFVYLATHAANHAFLRASWLVDLERYLRLERPLDWPTMDRWCREAGFHDAVATALWVLRHHLCVALPSESAGFFRLGRVKRAVAAALFSAGHLEAADLSSHRLWSFGLRLALVDSPRHGLRHGTDGVRRLVRQLRAPKA